MELSSILLLTTIAGYGDPVDGFPSAAERSLVLWTNAARVAPKEFKSEYSAGGCSYNDFESGEKTAKNPLYIDLALTEAARYHSDDMRKNGCFQHESCDGTDTWARIGRYYDDSSYLGENIAYGSSDAKYTVMTMWMCSSGHRANIMTGDYNEMGGGVSKDYMTQDFAAGTLAEGDPPVRVATEYGSGIYADWQADESPASITAYVNGEAIDLDKVYGETENGIYFGEAKADECSPWFVAWTTRDGESGTFPATGAFLGGGCDTEYDENSDVGGDGTGGPGNLDDNNNDENVSDNPYAVKELKVVCATGGLEAGLLASVAAAVFGTTRRRRT